MIQWPSICLTTMSCRTTRPAQIGLRRRTRSGRTRRSGPASWVGDIEDVDVLRFLVIGGDQVDVFAGLPQEGAVVWFATCGWLAASSTVKSPKFSDSFFGFEQVGDVPQRDTALAVLAARLVVDPGRRR